jgi:hypothetical protein
MIVDFSITLGIPLLGMILREYDFDYLFPSM